MCGFTGVIQFRPNDSLSVAKALRMNRMLEHRGPDGEGYFFFGENPEAFVKEVKEQNPSLAYGKKSKISGFLGHRRLSIIDLSIAAAQPMPSIDGQIQIVFNGEIYNHAEIRKELRQKGVEFQTDHSDTEVIINSYQEWGIEGLHKLRGMFAIVLIDFTQERIFLIRDRIGVKPLYYSLVNGELCFASELKAIINYQGKIPPLREQSIADFMSFLTVPAPHTMFKSIFKVPAANWICFDFKGNKKEAEYWDVFDNYQTSSPEAWETKVLSGLKESVRYRMESDVPVGVFLSGGIDSSANALLFSQLNTKEKIKSFTVGYSGSKSHENEFSFAKQIADQIHSQHHELILTQKDVISFLPKMVFHQDEPLADPVCIPLYYVAKMAVENGIKVCQLGEGSDELFIGYTDWITKTKLQKAAALPFPKALKAISYSVLEGLNIHTATAREFLRRDSVNLPVFWSGAEAFTEAEKSYLFSRPYWEENKLQSPDAYIRHVYEQFLLRCPEPSICRWMSYADMKLRLPELLLMRVDKMTMATGLEAREPFLDHEFASMALSIPDEEKIAGYQNKAILKQSLKGLVPDEILFRPKQGFSVPVKEWLSEALGQEVETKIQAFQKNHKIFEEKHLQDFLRSKHRGIWNIYNLALWEEGLKKYL